jgi:hypothetical protein
LFFHWPYLQENHPASHLRHTGFQAILPPPSLLFNSACLSFAVDRKRFPLRRQSPLVLKVPLRIF